MKCFWLIGFIILGKTIYAQSSKECELNLRLSAINVDMNINSITEDEYNKLLKSSKIDSLLDKTNITDTSESFFQDRYPQIFNKINGCYTFKLSDGKDVKVCNNPSIDEPKEWTEVKFVGTVCDYVIVSEFGYESWQYYSVNIKSGKAFPTLGIPQFFNCNILYAYDSYYSNAEIYLRDIARNKEALLLYDEWEIVEAHTTNMGMIIKLSSWCNEMKYIHAFMN